jgi:sugar phosphate isomerase/epimerase
MKLGVMTTVLPRPSIDAVAEAVRAAGLGAVQLNLESAGLEPLPEFMDGPTAHRIGAAFAERGIQVAALSGTFNAIHPDRAWRAECIRRVGRLAGRCSLLGTSVITLCTGTRNPENMWRHHPDNGSPEAWAEMVETMRALMPHAEAHGVDLAFEPEVVNVVDTAKKAERLIAEVGSPRLRLVMDPANYFHPEMLPHMQEVLEDVFARVGAHIALAHAKDVRPPDPGRDEPGRAECVRPAAGTGVLDYATYIRLLRESGYTGAPIMHSLSEAELPASKAYVERHLRNAG